MWARHQDWLTDHQLQCDFDFEDSYKAWYCIQNVQLASQCYPRSDLQENTWQIITEDHCTAWRAYEYCKIDNDGTGNLGLGNHESPSLQSRELIPSYFHLFGPLTGQLWAEIRYEWWPHEWCPELAMQSCYIFLCCLHQCPAMTKTKMWLYRGTMSRKSVIVGDFGMYILFMKGKKSRSTVNHACSIVMGSTAGWNPNIQGK
jgi:hypothetical protein